MMEILSTFPFLILLLGIAFIPLVPQVAHHWEKHHVKLIAGLALGAIVVGYYGFRARGFEECAPGLSSVRGVLERAALEEFTPFFTLLFSLYVVSGGLRLSGDLKATPGVNAAFLAFGAILASVIGTTGASMLLVRPLVETNRERQNTKHVFVFFIYLVSNIGGCLSPIGDPPLFLGYIAGVPFLWTLGLAVPWLFCVGSLLTIFYIWDRIAYGRETPLSRERDERLTTTPRLLGGINLVWLIVIVAVVGAIQPGRPVPGTSIVVRDFVREAIMLAVAALSLATTPRGLRREAEFTYDAIIEIACLFLGIFLTMQPAIELLRARGPSLGLETPASFYWATGLLSSFLDNAPTYKVFFETARSSPTPSDPSRLVELATAPPIRADLLRAISLGSVFMGATTYIGNGPNFMVKRIVEDRGTPMPSFLAYMGFSVLVLGPLFAAVHWIFLR